MWIERVEIRGFKRLSGKFDLGEGITVVVGPNESGKSSLHEALIRSLYGFSGKDRRKNAGASALDRTAPWNGGDHGVVAFLRLGDGDARRAAWSFADHSLQLTDPMTGDDLTSTVAGKKQDYTLGPALLGVELDEFRQVCCLDQAAIGAVERSEPLQLLLQRAVETGDGEAGVDHADKILRAFLARDGRIAVRVDTLNPLAGGALDLADQRVAELETQLEDADRSRVEVERLAVELLALRDQRSAHSSALAANEQQLLLGRAQRAEEQHAAAREEGDRANADVAEPGISEDLELCVQTARSELATTRDEQQGIEPAAAVARERIAELERDRLAIEPQVTQLDPYEHVDDASEGRVHELLERRIALREEGGQQDSGGASEPAATSSVRRLHAAGLAVGLVSVGLAVVVTPAALAGLAVAVLVALIAYLRNAREAGAMAERESRSERTASMRAQADRNLEEVLEAAGASPSDDLDIRARTYLDACGKKRTRAGLATQLAKVRADAAAADEPLRSERQLAARVDRLADTLSGLYREAAIDATSLETAGRRFDELAREARTARAAATRSEAAAAALGAALAGRTLGELEAEAEQARQRLREHVEHHGALASTPGDETILEAAVESNRVEIAHLDRRSAEIDSKIETLESLNQSPAELKEQLAQERDRATRLRAAAAAAGLARETLEQSAREAYRQVAPHLKRALERNLPRVTGSRYAEAAVDDQLQIRVVPPETPNSVDVDALSRGTQDQIYFLERLELARLLDRTIDRPPLLLDDPFVHFDAERRRFALELLVEAAADGRQVILFSTDTRLADEARDLCDCRVIELSAPEAPDRDNHLAGALVGGVHE